jgi:hypothetical protein
MFLMIFSLFVYISAPHTSPFRGGGNYTMREDILHDWWFLQCLSVLGLIRWFLQCLSVLGLIIELNIRVGINLNLKSDKSRDHFGEHDQK